MQNDKNIYSDRFEVFTTLSIKMLFFWVLKTEKHTVSIFRPEDGDGMFLRNVGVY
jgi:hypothetical protein